MNNNPTPILPFIQERLEPTKKEIKDDLFLWLSGKKHPNLEFSGTLVDVYWGPSLDGHVKKIIDTAFATNREIATDHGLDPSKSVNDGTIAAEQTIKEILNLMADYDRRMRGKGYPKSVPLRDIKEFWNKHSESVRTRAENEYNLLSISKKGQSAEVPSPTTEPPTKNAENKPKHENRKWWAIFVVTFLCAVFAYPAFHQFIKQMFAANQENAEKSNKGISPEKSSIHHQSSSSRPVSRPQR